MNVELPSVAARTTSLSEALPPGRALPELLAPAGDWECAKAAVENGADAIYFGLEKFNARMRARNFTVADLPKLMWFLHHRGVKGYVTFNTLVFADEMTEAEQHLRSMISAGVDAAIVQDVGICRLIRRLSPDFPIHASTQMTVTSAAGVEFVRDLGCNLVVLARECSLTEIEKIQAAPAGNRQLPLEVFVHGALCVAYSGQCLTSEALGGRSANRGECAQACRMPYELIADGKPVSLGDRKYLLSPQDLAGLDVLPNLARSGVASLKIEGRLKSPEYVANITRVYRQALDRLAGKGVRDNSAGAAAGQPPESDHRYEMEMAFSRGLFTGWFRGIDNRALVHARFGKKRGVYLGEVTKVGHDNVVVKIEGPLKPGDGVVFDAGHPEEKEEGGRVYEIENPHSDGRNTRQVALRFGRDSIDFNRVHPGDKLWKTSDPELDRRLRRSFAGNSPKYCRPIQIEAHGRTGEPLTLIVRDELGHVARLDSVMLLTKAENQPLTRARLREQLGRLGGTPFKLGELTDHLENPVMLPVSELNRLRREAVAQLTTLRSQPKRWALLPTPCPSETGEARSASQSTAPQSGDAPSQPASRPPPELVVLVRNLPQLNAAMRCDARTIYCEFEDPKKYRDAVALFRTARTRPDPQLSAFDAQPSVWVAPPRITKTGEEWILKLVRSCEADGYLIRNYDHLGFFAGCRRVGDFSLNVANALTADYFIHRYGLERVTASYDLNAAQLEALLRTAPPEWFEITIHQHVPMFHMEHCVFCAFLSSGKDFRDCGRPCDTHDVQLRDRVGALHPLKADAGCRNTVFNSLAQTGAEFVGRMMELGARRFRIEFLNETPEQVAKTITMYRQLLRGEISGGQLWRELRLLNQLGVTRGPML